MVGKESYEWRKHLLCALRSYGRAAAGEVGAERHQIDGTTR